MLLIPVPHIPPQTVTFRRELFIRNLKSGLPPFIAYIRTMYVLTVPCKENHASSPMAMSGTHMNKPVLFELLDKIMTQINPAHFAVHSVWVVFQ